MKKITLYTKKNCSVCLTAKHYFEQQGWAFRLCDIANPRFSKEFASLKGRSVPLIKVGDQIIRGFSIKSIQDALQRE